MVKVAEDLNIEADCFSPENVSTLHSDSGNPWGDNTDRRMSCSANVMSF